MNYEHTREAALDALRMERSSILADEDPYDECDRLSQYTNPADDRLNIPKEGEPCL